MVEVLGPQLRTIGPRSLERIRLDNAALLAHRIYATDLDLFDGVLAREDGDLKRAIARVIALAKATPKDPFEALRAWLGAGGPSAAKPAAE